MHAMTLATLLLDFLILSRKHHAWMLSDQKSQDSLLKSITVVWGSHLSFSILLCRLWTHIITSNVEFPRSGATHDIERYFSIILSFPHHIIPNWILFMQTNYCYSFPAFLVLHVLLLCRYNFCVTRKGFFGLGFLSSSSSSHLCEYEVVLTSFSTRLF